MLLEINFTAVLFSISFLVFIYLLNLTLFKPVGNIVEARANLIEGDYEKSKDFSERASKTLEEYSSQTKAARQEAMKLVDEAISKAQGIKQEKVNSLIASVQKEKEDAMNEIKKEQASGMAELESKVKELTNLITSKVIGEKDLVSTP